MKPVLSILIPTRNRCELLRFTIQSALNIPSQNIEILVSENHGSDDGLAVCQSFNDSRLRVLRPANALPMHENFEYLLQQSRGEWVTFIGDDDAIMPHAVDHLTYLTEKYPQAEAVYSPRAYYFWKGVTEIFGNNSVNFSFDSTECWRDSKKQLNLTLRGELDYIYLPQMYSGGFHRRSLINRVLRSQNGVYFRSVTPDAYSALMACVQTYRYLQTGIPMTWVGSSPHQALKSKPAETKNREQDFFGLHSDDSLTVHRSLGDLKVVNFTLHFFEAYVSAFPLTSYKDLSMSKVRQIYVNVVRQLRKMGGKEAEIKKLSHDLGFEPTELSSIRAITLYFAHTFTKKAKTIYKKACAKLSAITSSERNRFSYRYRSESHIDHPNILAADHLLAEGYARWLTFRQYQDEKKI